MIHRRLESALLWLAADVSFIALVAFGCLVALLGLICDQRRRDYLNGLQAELAGAARALWRSRATRP